VNFRSHALSLSLLLATVVSSLNAQDGALLTAGYLFAGDSDESTWRLTIQRDLADPIGFDIAFQVLPGERPKEGDLVGFGLDLTLFEGAQRFPTVFIGGAAGVGLSDQDRVWYGSSIGLRMPLVTVMGARTAIEGRWRNLSVDGRNGVELGFAIGWHRARASGTGSETSGLYVPRATGDRLRAAGIPAVKANLLGDVVSTALEEMGQPYVWGGTGDGDGGFDCSGLIYFAYGKYGVRIPRTAQGQSEAGVPIRRDIDALIPGDILTFSENGDRVTHVGLYVGEGRFIHSASSGVRLSRLAQDDSYGKYWLARWQGVRRIVE
jgi:cell wall-associated NlpC family hydrolase